MKRLIPILVCIIILSIACAIPAAAQDDQEEPTFEENQGRGYFMFGVHFLDIDDLNTRLASLGYAKFPTHFYTIGGGAHGILESGIVIGGEGHALLSQKETTGTFKTALGGGYGFFNVGYVVYQQNDFTVYPLLGIGGGSVTMKITDSEAPLFDEVIGDPKRSTELSTGGFLLDMAVGLDYLFQVGEDERDGGIMIGLRAGYTFSPSDSDWEMNGNEINGGPDFGVTGPYVRLMIGGGGGD